MDEITESGYFVWDGSLNLGIPEIDNQHKNLVKTLNDAYAAITGDKISAGTVIHILKDVVDHSFEHFETEEKLMRDCNFSEIREHLEEHTMYKTRLHSLVGVWIISGDKLAILELSAFVKDWINEHVAKIDIKLKGLIS